MHTRMLRTAVLLVALCCAAGAARAATYGKTTGHVTTLRVNDLRDDRMLDPSEKRYAFYVRLDSQPRMVLGFNPGPDGTLPVAEQAMFELLQQALEHNWTVEIRWRSAVITFKDRLPPHATILSVGVSMRTTVEPEEPEPAVRRIGDALK